MLDCRRDQALFQRVQRGRAACRTNGTGRLEQRNDDAKRLHPVCVVALAAIAKRSRSSKDNIRRVVAKHGDSKAHERTLPVATATGAVRAGHWALHEQLLCQRRGGARSCGVGKVQTGCQAQQLARSETRVGAASSVTANQLAVLDH